MNFNLELILLVATAVTALIWISGSFFKKKGMFAEGNRTYAWFLDISKTFFPVLFIVLVLRSLIIEPFRIPSGSMYPSLHIGDFILVQKFAYALKVPVFYKLNFWEFDQPKRGDVVVFRYPNDTSIDYIKRIIGLPGDTLEFTTDGLKINGEKVQYKVEGDFEGMRSGSKYSGYTKVKESYGGKSRSIIKKNFPSLNFQNSLNAKLIIPENQYFVMGDNRDNSSDSRAWGFVPEENIKGKAIYVWLNWDNGLRVERLGLKIE